MRRSIVVVVVCIAAGVAAAVTLGGGTAHRVVPATGRVAPPGPTSGPGPATVGPAGAAPRLNAAQIRATASTWVAAMWARRPGQGPFAWLDEVAAITSPDLLAELRTALPTLEDQLTIAVTVDIDGVYPSALDPGTVTVTCQTHVRTAAGVVDQACATTVTVEPGADGQPTVTEVQ